MPWLEPMFFPVGMTLKFHGLEGGERKSCGQSPCRSGGVSHQQEASCCASGSLKAASCLPQGIVLGGIFIILLFHNACPYTEHPICLYLLPPMGMRVAGLRHSWVIHQWGYLTRSGLSLPSLAWDCKWDQLEKATDGTLGQDPLLGQGCAGGSWWVWVT